MVHVCDDVEAIKKLLDGGVGVMPTDTVYGLVARAHDKQAVARMYALKQREHKPGTVIAASVEQLIELGFDEHTLRRVEHLWPASLSVVITTSPALAYLDQERGDQPVRIPADEHLRDLLEQTGPLVTSSANQPGEPTANTIEEAHAYFDQSIDFYVDGGELSERAPSTIVRITPAGHLEVLRSGAVAIDPEQTAA